MSTLFSDVPNSIKANEVDSSYSKSKCSSIIISSYYYSITPSRQHQSVRCNLHVNLKMQLNILKCRGKCEGIIPITSFVEHHVEAR